MDTENTNKASTNSDPNSQSEDDLDILIKSREKEAKTSVKMDTAEGSLICHLLNEFLKTPRLDKSKNVFEILGYEPILSAGTFKTCSNCNGSSGHARKR